MTKRYCPFLKSHRFCDSSLFLPVFHHEVSDIWLSDGVFPDNWYGSWAFHYQDLYSISVSLCHTFIKYGAKVQYFGQIYKSIPLLMQSCMVCGGQPRKNPGAPYGYSGLEPLNKSRNGKVERTIPLALSRTACLSSTARWIPATTPVGNWNGLRIQSHKNNKRKKNLQRK